MPTPTPFHGDTVPDGFTLVPWPENESYSDAPWFAGECRRIIGGDLLPTQGNPLYLVPDGRINDFDHLISEMPVSEEE